MRNGRKAATLLGGVLGLSAIHIYANTAEKPVAYTTEEARAIAMERLINFRDRGEYLRSWAQSQLDVLRSNPEAPIQYDDEVSPRFRKFVDEGDSNNPNRGRYQKLYSGMVKLDRAVVRSQYLLENFSQLSDKSIRNFVSATNSNQGRAKGIYDLYAAARYEEEHPSLTKKIAAGAEKFGRGFAFWTSRAAHNTAFNYGVIWTNWVAQFKDWYGLNFVCVPWYLVKTIGCTLCPIWSVSIDEYQDKRLGQLGFKKGLQIISDHEMDVAERLGFGDYERLRYYVEGSKIAGSGGDYCFSDTSHWNTWN